MLSEQSETTDPYAELARAARALLDVYDQGIIKGKNLLGWLTAENIETLRELATWDGDNARQDPTYTTDLAIARLEQLRAGVAGELDRQERLVAALRAKLSGVNAVIAALHEDEQNG